MKVLVAYASKHGSTKEIAEAIGLILKEQGLNSVVKSMEDVQTLTGFDAVVAGSAVYAGQWLRPARSFVKKHTDDLIALPTWLFSSGPIGEPLRPQEEAAVDIESVIARNKIRDHKLFAGKLDKAELSFAERAMVMAVRGKTGDYRNWDEVTAWAMEIVEALKH